VQRLLVGIIAHTILQIRQLDLAPGDGVS
jgi:hypothetical protein